MYVSPPITYSRFLPCQMSRSILPFGPQLNQELVLLRARSLPTVLFSAFSPLNWTLSYPAHIALLHPRAQATVVTNALRRCKLMYAQNMRPHRRPLRSLGVLPHPKERENGMVRTNGTRWTGIHGRQRNALKSLLPRLTLCDGSRFVRSKVSCVLPQFN